MEQVEVVIIGGGPAGSAAAIGLSRAGMSAALLERSHYDNVRVGEILAPAARLPLCALAVWDRFCACGFARSPGIVSAWGQPELSANDFVTNPFGGGWHVDRRRFDRMMVEAAGAAGATVHTDVGVLDCHRVDGAWHIATRVCGEPLWFRANFVIDATGRASWFARRLGHRRTVYDRLVAVVGHVDRSDTAGGVRDQRALIESCRDGWWYSAELSTMRCVTAYLTDADVIARTRLGPAQQWRRRHGAPFTDARCGATAESVNIKVVSASTSRLRAITDGMSWLAIGDAAMACDPLWGCGVAAALESGCAAVESVVDRAALTQRTAMLERRFRDYRRLRLHYYGRETRWPDSVFWARRQSVRSDQALRTT